MKISLFFVLKKVTSKKTPCVCEFVYEFERSVKVRRAYFTLEQKRLNILHNHLIIIQIKPQSTNHTASNNFDANNDLQEDLKIFKSDTFENYKSFVPVEVQSLNFIFSQTKTFLQL